MVASTIVPRLMPDAPAFQIFIHRLQHGSAQVVFLQQMAELSFLCFRVRRQHLTQVHPREQPQHQRSVQRLFRAPVAPVDPLLQKIQPQHDKKRPPAAALLPLR